MSVLASAGLLSASLVLAQPAAPPDQPSLCDQTAEPDQPEPSPPIDRAAQLADARAALHADELARARELASNALAEQPDDVDALTVLGMVEAKAGDSDSALQHFDAALAHAGASARAGLRWNRGACLAALGRHAEAERAFLDAARGASTPLDVLCWLNAGYAALDGGALARARTHLARARELDRTQALQPELADLESELATRTSAEHARLYGYLARGELDRAQRELARALVALPDDAVVRYLAGIVAYRQERSAEAESQLKRARALGLDQTRDALARDYLELIAGGLWLTGRGLHADLELGGGYDSNAVQAGLADSNPLLAQSSSVHGGPYALLHGELSYGLAPSASAFVVARYSVQQLAYSARALDVYDSQQHELALEAEQRVGASMRVGALARGAFEVAGLADLRAFSFAGGGELWAALLHAPRARTRLTAGAQYTRVIDDAYAFLSGTRLELGLDTALGCDRLRAGGSASYRGELIGTQRVAAALPAIACATCSASYVIPLAYDGPRAALWLSYRLLPPLRAIARATGELRMHRRAAYLALTPDVGAATRADVRHEHDARLGLGAGLSLELFDPLELDLDYDVTIARSNIDNSRGGDHQLDYANLSFVRHVLSLAAAAHF